MTAWCSAEVHKAQPSLNLQQEQQQAQNSRGRPDRQHDAPAVPLCAAPVHALSRTGMLGPHLAAPALLKPVGFTAVELEGEAGVGKD